MELYQKSSLQICLNMKLSTKSNLKSLVKDTIELKMNASLSCK